MPMARAISGVTHGEASCSMVWNKLMVGATKMRSFASSSMSSVFSSVYSQWYRTSTPARTQFWIEPIERACAFTRRPKLCAVSTAMRISSNAIGVACAGVAG